MELLLTRLASFHQNESKNVGNRKELKRMSSSHFMDSTVNLKGRKCNNVTMLSMGRPLFFILSLLGLAYFTLTWSPLRPKNRIRVSEK